MLDPRYTQVETEKQTELNNTNSTYDKLLDERSAIDQQNKGLVDTWKQTQESALNQQTQFQTDLVNQQRGLAEKDFNKETKSAYADYTRETDRFGVHAENLASQGLTNSSVSETGKVRMFNAVQNRIAIARESMARATMNFDNSIREAYMNRNIKLAELSYTQLEKQLAIITDSFNYKDQATRERMAQQSQINDRYYNRSQDVYNQITQEKNTAEDLRRYQEQFAYQKNQDAIAQANWQKEFELARKKASSSGGGGNPIVRDNSKYDLTSANMKDNGAGDGTYRHTTLGGTWRVRTTNKGVPYYEPADEKTMAIYNKNFA